MPTIIIRHVTKQYESGPQGPGVFSRMVTGTTRTLVDNTATDYIERTRTVPEPPDRLNALDDLSLTIRDGETLSIVGPSGCGKTTLLKVIAGLIKPDSGEVLYDGDPIGTIPVDKRGIGMVFQNYALYPHLRTRENIGFFDLVHNQPEKIPDRIRHIVQVMGVQIEHLLSRKPPTLSGGEQQRVAVARCLARDPKLFLFDEPLSNLDAKLRVETRVQIKRLLQHYNITSVYVTHDQTEAIALADRIAVMRAGKIEQIGTFRNLYDTPKNAFIAQFFGTPPMNLFSGHAHANTWEGPGFSIGPIRPDLGEGKAVWLGIRAEDILIADTGIPVEVELVEPIFAERRQLVYVRLADQRLVVSTSLDVPLRSRARVHLEFPPADIYLFDAPTGARIG